MHFNGHCAGRACKIFPSGNFNGELLERARMGKNDERKCRRMERETDRTDLDGFKFQ